MPGTINPKIVPAANDADDRSKSIIYFERKNVPEIIDPSLALR
jgi:hypothetical protein